MERLGFTELMFDRGAAMWFFTGVTRWLDVTFSVPAVFYQSGPPQGKTLNKTSSQ